MIASFGFGKMPLKTPLISFGILALLTRIFLCLKLMYYQFNVAGTWLFLVFGIISCLFGIVLLGLAIYRALKKNIKPIFIFVGILLIVYFFPFEYVLGWIRYQLNSERRYELVNSLRSGKYDPLISKGRYYPNTAWVNQRFL
jgi:hypothetical protein